MSAEPSGRQPPPLSLIIISQLFFASGLWSLLDMINTIGTQVTLLNFGVLGLFIGVGLLRYNQQARKGALVFLWLGMILFPLLALMTMVTDPANLHFWWYGKRVEPTQNVRLIVSGLVMLCFGFTYWMYRVLRGPKVRSLFGIVVVRHPEAAATEHPGERY